MIDAAPLRCKLLAHAIIGKLVPNLQVVPPFPR